ncbi:Phospholipase DDHD2 [Orchesella cincta]|uniref:Phospholipase DDHD2 n=1 Tax=Orchesella cincta TaxID=48709 RepID=A0A1D2NFS5_ORCCI|nr:Phospholipase DDHD2 [Orchesella cincta]
MVGCSRRLDLRRLDHLQVKFFYGVNRFPGDAGGISSSSYAFGTPTPSLTAVASPLQASRPSVASTVQAATAYFPHPPEGQQFIPQRLSPLTYHWFHRKDIDGKTTWKPFSIIDSVALEDAFANDPDRLVSTDGGRYDVSVKKRVKMAVYWEEAPVDVRRGSWFFKGPMDKRFVPYDEEFSKYLEKEYSDCMSSGVWQKRLEFPDGESVILHNAGVVVHFCQAAAPDDWGNLPESQIRPRVVKRGCDEMEVEDGEAAQVDHLVFVVHGIGPICDFKLRNIVEAVDDFRGLSFQLINSHFRESIEKNMVGRVEFLPVSWHKALHGDKGIDEQLKRITLRSIPKFRDFTNDTLLDILFYTSPMFCQVIQYNVVYHPTELNQDPYNNNLTIITSVGGELNRLYKLFLTRNPSFKGQVSLTGHSLGSLILFDLLAHQPRGDTSVTETDIGGDEQELLTAQVAPVEEATPGLSQSRIVSYTVGNAGTGQPYINYPPLDFNPTAFFALGSPIAMFVTVRGIENLGNDFRLPTCAAFFNIFHPYDPVAYRMETLIDPTFDSRPVLIPHHKGRKRIHLGKWGKLILVTNVAMQ